MTSKEKSYWYQGKQKRENRHRILSFLQDKPRTFTELQKLTGFSPMGLTKMLEDLVEQKKITRGGKKGVPYRIAGGTHAKELMYLGDKLSSIVDNGGKFYVDYTDYISHITEVDPDWGMLSHLFLDKEIGKKFNPLSKQDIFEIENYIYDKLLQNVKQNKIKVDSSIDAKFVIGFEINYDQIMESIENFSLENYNKFIKVRTKELKQ